MIASPDHLFVRYGDAVARIGLDGSVRRLAHRSRRDFHLDFSGRLWMSLINPGQAAWIDPRNPDVIHAEPLPPGYMDAVRDRNGSLWAANAEQAVLLDHGRPVRQLNRKYSSVTSRRSPLLAGRSGQVWFLGEYVSGLVEKTSLRDHPDGARFPPTAGLEDSRGNLWIAAQGRGLLEWSPVRDWRRWFQQDFGNGFAVQLVQPQGDRPLLVTTDNLYKLQEDSGQWSPILSRPLAFAALAPFHDGGFLASVRRLGVARLSPAGAILESWPDNPAVSTEYREVLRDGKGRYWVGSKRGLFRVEHGTGTLQLVPVDLPAIPPGGPAQAVDLELDEQGRLWVGYETGLAWLDENDLWHRIEADEPVTSLRSFALGAKEIWAANRRQGAFFRLSDEGSRWKVDTFSAAEGYLPADTHFIKRDSRGWIWRGSTAGIHVSDGRHFQPNDWIHIHTGNGLAADETGQYSFFEDRAGFVWIASDEGLTRFRPSSAWFDAPADAPPPQLTRLEADGHAWDFVSPTPPPLPAPTKVLRVHFGTLRASPFRDFPLRYRLLPVSTDWQLSKDGSIEFRNLDENDYLLEVGYAGLGSSAVTTCRFRIGSGAPSITRFWPLGLLVASGAAFPILRRSIWFERTKFRVEKAVFLFRRRRRDRLQASDEAEVFDYTGTSSIAATASIGSFPREDSPLSTMELT